MLAPNPTFDHIPTSSKTQLSSDRQERWLKIKPLPTAFICGFKADSPTETDSHGHAPALDTT